MKKILLYLFISGSLSYQLGAQTLISYYSFNDGTTNDQVGNIHGANNGAKDTTDRFGNPNMAKYFTNSAYIDCGDSAGTNLNNMNGISISCWTKTTQAELGFSSLRAIVSRWTGSASTEQYGLFSKANYHVLAVGTVYKNGLNLPGGLDTNWTHVVVTYGSSITYYINGVLKSSSPAGLFPGSVGTAPMFIGSQGGGARFFEGFIDDIKIFDGQIDSATVSNLYNESNPSVGINENTQTHS